MQDQMQLRRSYYTNSTSKYVTPLSADHPIPPKYALHKAPTGDHEVILLAQYCDVGLKSEAPIGIVVSEVKPDMLGSLATCEVRPSCRVLITWAEVCVVPSGSLRWLLRAGRAGQQTLCLCRMV